MIPPLCLGPRRHTRGVAQRISSHMVPPMICKIKPLLRLVKSVCQYCLHLSAWWSIGFNKTKCINFYDRQSSIFCGELSRQCLILEGLKCLKIILQEFVVMRFYKELGKLTELFFSPYVSLPSSLENVPFMCPPCSVQVLQLSQSFLFLTHSLLISTLVHTPCVVLAREHFLFFFPQIGIDQLT